MAGTDGGPRGQITEQLAQVHRLVHHGARVARHQAEMPPVRSYPEVEQAVRALHHALEEQDAGLERRLAALGEAPDPGPAEAANAPPAEAERASAALDDDQAFLQRLALEYARLQAASRPRGDEETASLAERGQQESRQLIRERISRAKPRAAAAERSGPVMIPPGTPPVVREGTPGPSMRCPACHQAGAETAAPGTGSPLFTCRNPECVVQAFDAEGAQSVEVPPS